MATRGMAPATPADVAYQLLSLMLLVAGLIVALLMPTPEYRGRGLPTRA
jgi:hypothetical protein